MRVQVPQRNKIQNNIPSAEPPSSRPPVASRMLAAGPTTQQKTEDTSQETLEPASETTQSDHPSKSHSQA